jgi:S1-C subfamily serine protease
VILGFPGGGDFNAQAAGVLRSIDATGLDIYARRSITRSIYELQGHVVRGDSGGPVVLGDGTVVGMTFAAAADGSNVGYALTSPQLIDALNTAKSRSGSVSTMSCTAD